MKQKYFSLCVSLLICMLFSTYSYCQTTYYVATPAQGGNDANAGTSLAAPFATISKAISKATVPGDSILVRSGTYTVTATVPISNKSGTAAKHIVISVYKPDMVNVNSRPVFDFSSMTVSGSNRGFTVTNVNYYDIYGIVIKGAGDNGMYMSGCSYCNITFCSFTRNRDTGLQIGAGSNHIVVLNCDSYENADLGAGTTSSGGNADGFAPKLDVGDTVIFRGCRAWMNSDDGWDGYLRTTTDNVTTFLEDCWAFRNGYYWLDGSTTSSQNGNGFKMGGSDTKNLAHNFVAIKCLAFYNKSNGFDQNSNAGSMYLYNNSAYQNGVSDYFLNSSPVIYKVGAELVLKNNMSLGARGVNIPSSSTPTRSLMTATNSFSTATTHPEILSFDTTGVTGMRKVDGSLPDINFMHLNPGAPMPYTYIDKGTVLSDVIYHDAAGVPYSGAAPDIGAFENYAANAPLPVKMLSFTAITNTNGVSLTWQTANESNNQGWNIERTTLLANSSWTSLAFMNGKNNSPSGSCYSYLDKTVASGTYYYRLKQVDLDGQTTYSNSILVKIENAKQHATIEVFPNPFKISGIIQYTVPKRGKISLALYNQEGRLMNIVTESEQQAGTYQKSFSGRNLATGRYYIRLAIGDEMVATSFIKE